MCTQPKYYVDVLEHFRVNSSGCVEIDKYLLIFVYLI